MAFPVWNNATSYDKGDKVERVVGLDTLFYTSLVDSNLNNTPETSPNEWDEFILSGTSGFSVETPQRGDFNSGFSIETPNRIDFNQGFSSLLRDNLFLNITSDSGNTISPTVTVSGSGDPLIDGVYNYGEEFNIVVTNPANLNILITAVNHLPQNINVNHLGENFIFTQDIELVFTIVTKEYYGIRDKILSVQSVPLIPEQILGAVACRQDLDICPPYTCEIIPAIENDISGFLFDYPSVNSDNTFKLEKFDGSTYNEVVTGNIDNALGVESGTKLEFNTAQTPTFSGFTLNWGLIFNYAGPGIYRFVADNDIEENKLFSLPFNLKEDTCDNKDRTVRIDFNSNNKFSNFLFTDTNGLRQNYQLNELNWSDGIRLGGRLISESPTIEKQITHFASLERERQLSDSELNYNLNLFKTTYETYSRLIYYGLDSDDITVTDNGSDSEFSYDKLPVIFQGETSKEKFVNVREIFNVVITLNKRDTLQGNKC